jgi:hypothetical protein
MDKLTKNIGLIVGLVIVLLSLVVFIYDVDIKTAKWADIKYTSVEAPEYEADKYYGGDAYSGIQNAAAQAANNAIAVYDEVKQGNEAVKTMNENLKAQAKADAENLESIAGLVKLCLGSILLSIGLLTIAKNIAPLKKEKEVSLTPVAVDKDAHISALVRTPVSTPVGTPISKPLNAPVSAPINTPVVGEANTQQ